MKIGQIDLGKYPILLAQLEDVTDPAYRRCADSRCQQDCAETKYQ